MKCPKCKFDDILECTERLEYYCKICEIYWRVRRNE